MVSDERLLVHSMFFQFLSPLFRLSTGLAYIPISLACIHLSHQGGASFSHHFMQWDGQAFFMAQVQVEDMASSSQPPEAVLGGRKEFTWFLEPNLDSKTNIHEHPRTHVILAYICKIFHEQFFATWKRWLLFSPIAVLVDRFADARTWQNASLSLLHLLYFKSKPAWLLEQDNVGQIRSDKVSK